MSENVKKAPSLRELTQKYKVGELFQKYTMVLALVLVTAFFALRTGGKTLLPANINNLIAQNAYVFVLAAGMLLCILTGGNIDLSVGSVVCFAAAVGTVMMQSGVNMWIAVLAMLAIGLAVGTFQGFWIAKLHVPAFIATLSGMYAFRGFSNVVLGGFRVDITNEQFLFLFGGKFLQADLVQPVYQGIPVNEHFPRRGGQVQVIPEKGINRLHHLAGQELPGFRSIQFFSQPGAFSGGNGIEKPFCGKVSVCIYRFSGKETFPQADCHFRFIEAVLQFRRIPGQPSDTGLQAYSGFGFRSIRYSRRKLGDFFLTQSIRLLDQNNFTVCFRNGIARFHRNQFFKQCASRKLILPGRSPEHNHASGNVVADNSIGDIAP